MQEQEKMEMVWQAPELVELGDIINDTQNKASGHSSDSVFAPTS